MKSALALALSMLCLFLAGCGGQKPSEAITGHWLFNDTPVAINQHGIVVDALRGPIWQVRFRSEKLALMKNLQLGSKPRQMAVSLRGGQLTFRDAYGLALTFKRISPEAYLAMRRQAIERALNQNLRLISEAAVRYFDSHRSRGTVSVQTLFDQNLLNPNRLAPLPATDMASLIVEDTGYGGSRVAVTLNGRRFDDAIAAIIRQGDANAR